ncbi:MAG: hypothetical protein KatS3mg027_0498 [Bacteroidia bacterium]|nr:MAG: hypothetical protein KatS3mg027_0498 [Bacteroidia bacterium]
MRKLGLIILLGFLITHTKAQTQSDTLQYVVMRVNNAILDCPHFGGIFFRFCNENNWKIVENNHQKRYIIFGLSKNVEYDALKKYNQFLEEIHYPKDVIETVVKKNTKEEVDEFIKSSVK